MKMTTSDENGAHLDATSHSNAKNAPLLTNVPVLNGSFHIRDGFIGFEGKRCMISWFVFCFDYHTVQSVSLERSVPGA